MIANCQGVATIPLFRRGRWRDSHDVSEVSRHLRVGLAPDIVVVDDAKWVRNRMPMPPVGNLDSRRALLFSALDAFENAQLSVGDSNFTRDDFHRLMDECVGLPATLIDRWTAMLREYVAQADPQSGPFTFVSLPENTFTCLEAVCAAVLGDAVAWVRPSRKEPMSSARFVAALLDAGWPPERIGYYATTESTVRTLVSCTDRQVIYGGDAVLRAFRKTPTATVRGPGGAVAIVDSDLDIYRTARHLLPGVTNDSGRFCTNVRTIIVFDNIEPLAEALAAQLDSVPLDQLARFPNADTARSIADRILNWLRPTDTVVTRRPLVTIERGHTYLAPLLVHVGEPTDHPLVGLEVPFPFATIVCGNRTFARGYIAGASRVDQIRDNRV